MIVKCADCVLPRPVRTINQYIKSAGPTYHFCPRMDFLVKPQSGHGCSRGIPKVQNNEDNPDHP